MNPLDYYKVRCKCEKCGRKQVRLISDLINGDKCSFGRLGQPTCGGMLNYYGDDVEDAKGNALNVLGYINAAGLIQNPKLAELVDSVVDDVGTWMEAQATPQEMGWVDSQGRP